MTQIPHGSRTDPHPTPADPATGQLGYRTGQQDSTATPPMFVGARYRNPDGDEVTLHTREFEGIHDHGELWWGSRIRDGRTEPILVSPRGLVDYGYVLITERPTE